MKKILITGANSYIGISFERFMVRWPQEYQVDTIDMIDGSWRQKSFKGYDTVFHVAGIAHQDSGRISEQKKKLYMEVNCDLAIETARKAKTDGAAQFIFMSTMSVYGQHGNVVHPVIITRDSKPNPQNAYGESKLMAEEGILALNEDSFQVCVLRPPMIYGPGCKGNYLMLRKAALKLPFFPDIYNERSMLFIDNLCTFVKAAIDETSVGVFFPQNAEYVSTSEMVRLIAMAHGKKLKMTKAFNPLLRFLSGKVALIDKVFGNLVVDQRESVFLGYPVMSLDESIQITESRQP